MYIHSLYQIIIQFISLLALKKKNQRFFHAEHAILMQPKNPRTLLCMPTAYLSNGKRLVCINIVFSNFFCIRITCHLGTHTHSQSIAAENPENQSKTINGSHS